MNTLHHFSRQGIFPVQIFAAVWAMLGLGLEGFSACQDNEYELHDLIQRRAP